MNRRGFLIVGAVWPALAWAGAVHAQAPAKVRQIGFLSSVSPAGAALWHQAFRLGLRERGWLEGKNISIEYRYAEGSSDRFAELATRTVAKSRLPSIFQWSEFADAGGIMTYGPDRTDMYRRAATFVDKILKGTKPADLPVEQPTKFELVVNMKTAKALGLTVPQTVMIQATRVIQ